MKTGFIAVAFMAGLVFAAPSHAQSASARPTPQALTPQALTPQALALAEQVIGVSTPDMEKQVIDYMAAVMGSTGLSEADANLGRWIEKNAGPILLPHLRTYMDEMKVLFAESYTEAELQAMVDFYTSPVGRGIASKQIQVAIRTEELSQPLMERYMMDLLTQMCANNDCNRSVSGAKPARR